MMPLSVTDGHFGQPDQLVFTFLTVYINHKVYLCFKYTKVSPNLSFIRYYSLNAEANEAGSTVLLWSTQQTLRFVFGC